jgi:rod shape-determining protein MreC
MRKFAFVIILMAVVIVIIILTPDYISSSFNSTFTDAIISPIIQLKRKSGMVLGNAGNVKPDELARLTVEMEQLKLENRQLKNLIEESDDIKQMLDYKKRSEYRLLAAEVMERNINNWWQIVRIDKGTRSGVQKNQPVVTSDGLVGRVQAVSFQSADVLLIIDSQSKISAKISHSDISGVVRGGGISWRGDPQCVMDFISKEAIVKAGDEVVSSGFGMIFPEGFVIGYVDKAIIDESGLFKSAEIVPAVDFKNLRRVFVVVK